MARQPVSVIVGVDGRRDGLRRLLDALRSTLGPLDELVVVDARPQPDRPPLPTLPRATRCSVEPEAGVDVACDHGADAARHDLLVFVSDDVVVGPRWLDGLVRALGDDHVAVGPVSNFAVGHQLVHELDYVGDRPADVKAFARRWSAEHRAEVTVVDHLTDSVVLVRRHAFDRACGWAAGHENGDLCDRLRASGTLAVANEVFVHHTAHRALDLGALDAYGLDAHEASVRRRRCALSTAAGRTRHEIDRSRPLLSACLIVRDEERDLGACLASIRDVADEIVVHDTGSCDGTVEIARAAGAQVIEGAWHDDFARARNTALEHCRGTWILHVDADERATADPVALRALLADPTTPDALLVPIDNVLVEGASAVKTHRANRLFRADRGRWVGRLHEQVRARAGQPALTTGLLPEGLRLVHHGYTPETWRARDKAARNLRMAEAEADAACGEGDRAAALSNLGRALVGAGRLAEAVDVLDEAAAIATTPPLHRLALRNAIEALLQLDRPGEALDRVATLRVASARPVLPDFFEACARLRLGDAGRALELLDGLRSRLDDDGFELPAVAVAAQRGLTLVELERWEAAADALLAAAPTLGGVMESLWPVLVVARWRAHTDLAPVARAIPAEELAGVLGRVAGSVPIEAADSLATSLWATRRQEPAVVAFASHVGSQCSLERALEWAMELRAAGFDASCPLLARAGDREAPAASRVLAAAVAFGAFGDPETVDLALDAAAAVPEAAFHELLGELDRLAPPLLEPFVLGAAGDPARCDALATALEAYDAHEQAAAVRRHGTQLATGANV